MPKIVIADLGTGNLRSVSKAVEYVAPDSEVRVSSDPASILNAGHLILPGQGAIGTWFEHLQRSPALRGAIESRLNEGPVLGICLGLQSLYDYSEENGGVDGLGLVEGSVKRFSNEFNRKVPHMGWNQVRQKQDHPLWQNIPDDERFYFVHSYYADTKNDQEVMAETEYGLKFTAAAARGNIFATQFHPEKSQHAGLQLINNFLNWNGMH